MGQVVFFGLNLIFAEVISCAKSVFCVFPPTFSRFPRDMSLCIKGLRFTVVEICALG